MGRKMAARFSNIGIVWDKWKIHQDMQIFMGNLSLTSGSLAEKIFDQPWFEPS